MTEQEVWQADFMRAQRLVNDYVKWNLDGSGYISEECPGPYQGFYWGLVKVGMARGYFDGE